MKNKIDICAGVTLLLGFVMCVVGLTLPDDFVFAFGLIVYLVMSITYILIEFEIYTYYRDDDLPDMIEDDIDTFEEARKKADELEDILK